MLNKECISNYNKFSCNHLSVFIYKNKFKTIKLSWLEYFSAFHNLHLFFRSCFQG